MSADPHPDCWGIDRSVYDCFCGVLDRKQRVACLGAWMRQQEARESIYDWKRLPWYVRLWEWLRW